MWTDMQLPMVQCWELRDILVAQIELLSISFLEVSVH